MRAISWATAMSNLEPSIGLHPRDIGRLIRVLHRLRDAGNTLVVVEHDPEVIRAADLVLDLGPGPGERGGEVVFFGSLKQLARSRRSLTAQYLFGARSMSAEVPSGQKLPAPSDTADGWLEVLDPRGHDEENRSASARCPAENYLDELDARALAAYRTMVLSRQADEWAVNAFLARWGRIRNKLLAGNSCEGYWVLKPLARWVLRAYTD